MTADQAYTTLVPAETLAGRLGDPGWVVVDTRFRLGAPDAGREAYRSGHIPGARYADLDRDLAAPPSPGSGRHPLPRKAAWARRIGTMGIDARSQVVCYDDAGGTVAARLWWMLRWAGHHRVAVLDGGWQAWDQGGYPTETGTIMPQRRSFAATYDDRQIAATGEILARLTDTRWCLLDARAPERFRGETEPIDKVAGHVPGAVNAPCSDNLDAAGRFRSAAELEARYRALLGGVPSDATVVMCGSGVTACHDILAMTLAGLAGARLYVGSWSAWSADPARPITPGR